MKKKLLSLVLAGAMVASTSVSAFADATETTYKIENSKEVKHQVTVKGNVTDSKNTIVPGTISVTIPTAVSFRVDSNGDIDSAEINIKSDSEDSVDIIAYKFIDPSEDSKITVVPQSQLNLNTGGNTPENRYISLNITGGNKDVALKSSNGKTTGIIKSGTTEYEENDNPVIGTVTRNKSLNLRIEGKAAKESDGTSYTPPTSPIRDDFQLILKIKKTTQKIT